MERAQLRLECLKLALQAEARGNYPAASVVVNYAETLYQWASQEPQKEAAKPAKGK